MSIQQVVTVIELARYSENPQPVFNILNYVFILLYTVEAIVKYIALKNAYFKSKWNILDLLILLVAYIDVILDWSTELEGK